MTKLAVSRLRQLAFIAVVTGSVLSLMSSTALAICGGRAPADVVFLGVAQAGPSSGGRLLSPATFIVDRYIKGDGPRQVQVTTGMSEEGDGVVAWISTGVYPRVGERWEIRATKRPSDGVLTTSTCHGSQRLEGEAELIATAGPDEPPSRFEWVVVLAAGTAAAAVVLRKLERRRTTTTQ